MGSATPPNPAVSVVLCAFNGRRYLGAAIESVLAQTFDDFEVVVVDDGSTDGSADLVEQRFRDPRIRLVRQAHGTLRTARRTAVEHARGRFLACLDQDDVWLPGKLARQMEVARQAPHPALVFSDCLLIDADGRTIGRLSNQYDFESMDLTGMRGYAELLRRGCFVAFPTALVEARALAAVGGFDRRFEYVEDYDLWLRLARHHHIACVPEPLAAYRVHDAQFTRRHPDVALREQRALLRPILRSRSHPPDVRSAIGHNLFGQHRLACRDLARQHRYVEALRAAAGALRYPVPLRDYVRHRVTATGPGRALRAAVRGVRAAVRLGTGRARPHDRETAAAHADALLPTEVWLDGSPLGGVHTGYFSLLSESIRHLATRGGSRLAIHVVTDRLGRGALVDRLGAEAASIHFHPLGWRAVHWSHLQAWLFGWKAHGIVALLSLSTLAAGLASGTGTMAAAAGIAVAVQCAVLIDAALAEASALLDRPRLAVAARLVRFLWRRWPAWRRGGGAVEVLFWRGRFRFRDSHRIAVVQDMTPVVLPECHVAETVSEFGEFLGYVTRRAHEIVTVSEHSRGDILARLSVPPDAVRVVPMPVHPAYRQPSFRREVPGLYGAAGPYVLCVGTIEPRKNLRRLVAAFDEVRRQRTSRGLSLVLAGPRGWDDGFRDYLLAARDESRLHLPGFVPDDHLPSLYHFAEAVVYPSLYEGFGLPVLEAMCCGAAVVTSRASSLPEVLGPEGIFFDPRDADDIARAIGRVVDMSPTEDGEYRRYCRQRADAHLSRSARHGLLGAAPAGGRPTEAPDCA